MEPIIGLAMMLAGGIGSLNARRFGMQWIGFGSAFLIPSGFLAVFIERVQMAWVPWFFSLLILCAITCMVVGIVRREVQQRPLR